VFSSLGKRVESMKEVKELREGKGESKDLKECKRVRVVVFRR